MWLVPMFPIRGTPGALCTMFRDIAVGMGLVFVGRGGVGAVVKNSGFIQNTLRMK